MTAHPRTGYWPRLGRLVYHARDRYAGTARRQRARHRDSRAPLIPWPTYEESMTVEAQEITGHPTVAAAAYDPQRQEMAVTFNDGSVYRYKGVDVMHYRHLIDGPSSGMFRSGPENVVWAWEKVK